MAYECSLCSGEENAALLITPLTGGETMAVGPSCMGIALIGMTAGHYEVDADKLMAAVDRLVKRTQADAAKGAGDGDAEGQADDVDADGAPGGSGASPPGGDPQVSVSLMHPPGGPDSHREAATDPTEGGPVAQLPQRASRHARADQ